MKPTTRPGASLLRHVVGLLTLAFALVPAGATRATPAVAPAAISADEAVEAALGRPAGATLQGLGSRVSQMGPDGNTAYEAAYPAIAYNTTDNQYLVVWYGDTNTGELVDDEFAIWGQRLGPAGAALGVQFRVSASGPADGSPAYGASNVGVVGGAGGAALVVWQADSALGGLVDDELEIWGRVLRQQQQRSNVYLPLVRR